MKPMKHVDHSVLKEAIARMESNFNSHELLQDIMTYHPKEYVLELYAKLETDDPILQAHSDIASRLNFEPFTELVENTGTKPSTNVRGNRTHVHTWKKRTL